MLDKEAIKKAVETITAYDYGTLILHTDFMRLFDLEPSSKDYYHTVSAVQRECLEAGKMLENIHNIGYRVVRPDDYSKQALRQCKLGVKRISMGQKILDYAPTKEMSAHALKEYREIKDRTNALNAHLTGGIVEMKMLHKSHPLLQGAKEGEPVVRQSISPNPRG